jgi:hypothetical protein
MVTLSKSGQYLKISGLTKAHTSLPLLDGGIIYLTALNVVGGYSDNRINFHSTAERDVARISIPYDEISDKLGTTTPEEYIDAINALNYLSTVPTKTNINTGSEEVLVNPEGHQCGSNTTVLQLGPGEVFTGSAWQDTLNYGVLSINISTDIDSAVDGLEIQWSSDKVARTDSDVFSIFANNPKTYTFGPAQRYYRIKYTNGTGGTTTSFHITSLLRRVYVKPSSHRINDNIVGEDDAELIKSVLSGEDDNGIFQNVKTDLGGLLRVNSFPYTYAIAEGDILNHTSLLKFGTRSNTTTTMSSIWEGNTPLYAYMTVAQQLKVSSSSVADSAAGTGIRTLRIYGLDANYDEITEDIPMQGTTVVSTTLSYIRVFRAYGITCGTNETNVGKITIYNNAGNVEQAVINIGDGQTLMTLWTVPRGKKAYIVQGTFSSDSNRGARVSLFVRQQDGGILYPWLIKYRAFVFSGNERFPFVIPFAVPEKTDIEIRCLAVSNGADVGATFELWYEDA